MLLQMTEYGIPLLIMKSITDPEMMYSYWEAKKKASVTEFQEAMQKS